MNFIYSKNILYSLPEVYRFLNKQLIDISLWSAEEERFGKNIIIHPEWAEWAQEICYGYKDMGWKVYWFRTSDNQYLQFEFPSIWKKTK